MQAPEICAPWIVKKPVCGMTVQIMSRGEIIVPVVEECVLFSFFSICWCFFCQLSRKKKAMLANTNWGANKLEEQWRSPHRSFHLKIRNVQLQAKVERGLNIRGIFSNIFNHLAGARKVCANELYLSAVLQGRNTIFK